MHLCVSSAGGHNTPPVALARCSPSKGARNGSQMLHTVPHQRHSTIIHCHPVMNGPTTAVAAVLLCVCAAPLQPAWVPL